jgi:hypothetical protein
MKVAHDDYHVVHCPVSQLKYFKQLITNTPTKCHDIMKGSRVRLVLGYISNPMCMKKVNTVVSVLALFGDRVTHHSHASGSVYSLLVTTPPNRGTCQALNCAFALHLLSSLVS